MSTVPMWIVLTTTTPCPHSRQLHRGNRFVRLQATWRWGNDDDDKSMGVLFRFSLE